MHFVFWICLLLYLCATSIIADIPCMDPQGRKGYCKPFPKCKHFMYMMGEPGSGNLSIETRRFFHESRKACQKLNKDRGRREKMFCCRDTVIHCGEVNGDRVAHGRNADLLEFRWMARLVRSDNITDEGFCGGSLIDLNNVLTAAHCVESRNKQIYALLGEHDTKLMQDCIRNESGAKKCAERMQKIPVEKIIEHKDYASEIGLNDIAILHLQKPVSTTSANIQPICLQKYLEVKRPKTMIISGWGATEYGQDTNILQKAEVEVLSDSYCVSKLNLKPPNLLKNTFCAHSKNHSSTCKGDSGGPIFGEVTLGNYKRFYQFGVTSHGGRNCTGVFPSVYLNVNKYLDWIEENKKK